MRERHLTAQELAKPSEEQRAGLLTALRNRNKAGATDRLWAKDPAAVAEDFLKLRGEILRRVKERSAAAVAGVQE